jgi:gluconolactonase
MLERALQRVNMPKPNAPPRHGGYIQRFDPKTGKAERLYDSNSGAGEIFAPNDLVFDNHGGFYFTDHGTDGPKGRNYGGIFYAKTDGSFIEKMDFSFSAPNGIGLSPDGKTLYMADSFLGRLWAFDVVAPGKLGPPPPLMPAKVVGTMPGYYIFDSLKVEADGKICVGTVSKGGIAVFEADGSSIDHVPFPQLFVTNLCFGGKDMKDVYITGSGGTLWKGRWPRPGLKLNFNPYP